MTSFWRKNSWGRGGAALPDIDVINGVMMTVNKDDYSPDREDDKFHQGDFPPSPTGLKVKTGVFFMCFFLCVALVQVIRYIISPDPESFQHTVITVLAATVASLIASILAMRRMHYLYRRASAEAGKRIKVEKALRKAHDALGAKIKARTNELSSTNDMLQEEVIERRKVEKKLRESEEMYRTFLEETPVSITIFNEAGVVLFINRFHLKTFSRNTKTQDYFIGMSVFELPGLVNSGAANRMSDVLAGRTIELNDIFVPEFSGGHSGFMNLRAAPLFDNDLVRGGILIREDVTGRHKNEQELIKLNRALATVSQCHQALVRATDEPVMLKEICRALVDKGQYHLAWVGLARTGPEKLVVPAAQAGFDQDYLANLKITWSDDELGRGATGQAIRTGRTVYLEDLADAPEFAPWRTEAVKRGLFSKVSLPLTIEGAVIGALNIYKGKPSSFDAEEVGLLTKLADDLAYGMRARRMQAERQRAREERKTLETQLRQAQKMEALGALAGGIAHDFNNILGAVMGYTQLAIFELSGDDKALEYLDQVMTAGGRASDLVSQILTFSRQTESEKRPVHLTPIIKEALKLLRASIPSSIEINHNIDNSVSAALADPTQIHQVLMNLCTNSAQAIGDKGGVIHVSMNEETIGKVETSEFGRLAAGNWIRLTVTDNGGGIDPAFRDRIFEPYFTTKDLGKGTGLGLATVHGIVNSHNGDIILETEVGSGTSISVFLPLGEAEVEEQGEVELLCPRGCEKILLVDDERPLVELGRNLLEKLGYTVTGLTSSVSALEIFQEDPLFFDLVITDLTMPNLNGLDLTAKITALRPDLPVVLCTGFSSKISMETIFDAGIRGVILKPMLLHEMARTIRKVLNSHG